MGATHGHPRSWGEVTDEQVIERVAAGDLEAVGVLYDRHAALVFGLAVRLTRDHAIAADVVQDVFVKAWLRAGAFRAEGGDGRGWLLDITRRCVADVWRARPELQLAAASAPGSGLDALRPAPTP
jgi:DNA-directed RNA polymerase specialized sigma24 family protein